jgi:hypothetical protein
MLKTVATHEVHVPQAMSRRGDRYWNAALLPVSDGIFLVDIDWVENGFERIQSLVCPASMDGVTSMHSYEAAIRSMLFIPPPNHDGTLRVPPRSVDAIGIGHDAQDGFRTVLVVRTLDGQWHPCAKNVDLASLDQRSTLLVVDKGEPEVDAAQRAL